MDEKINKLTERIIGAAIEVHKALGPGLLESIYQKCFCHELGLRDIAYQVEVPVPLEYKGLKLSNEYRVDVLVEDLVVVELKAVDKLISIHDAQLLTYMKLTKKDIGLLINFNVPVLKQGIRRKVL